jgi:hypothetical protein
MEVLLQGKGEREGTTKPQQKKKGRTAPTRPFYSTVGIRRGRRRRSWRKENRITPP